MNNKFLEACQNGNLVEIQEYFNHKYIDTAFRYTCKNGQLKAAQLLYSLGANIFIIDKYEYMWICRFGHFEVIKWLCTIHINLCTYNDNAFIATCSSGHLELAQWFESKDINIHAENERAFKCACINGHLEIVKWLQSKNINIHVDNDYAFYWACYKDQFEIVKWLYQFDINLIFFEFTPTKKILEKIFCLNKNEIKLFRATISSNLKEIKEIIKEVDHQMLNHFVFKNSCHFNKIDIATYLSKLNPKYYFDTNENNEITFYEVRNIPKNARNIYQKTNKNGYNDFILFEKITTI